MTSSLLHSAFFSLAIVFVFLTPGAMWVYYLAHKNTTRFTVFEFLLLSFAISIGCVDFGMLILNRLHIPISSASVVTMITALIIAPIVILFFERKDGGRLRLPKMPIEEIGFSKRESAFFIGAFFLTLLFKTVFLWNAILPTSTDLGHHMYWAKTIVQTHALPIYQKANISFKDGSNTITNPEPIDDFIIGEHLPFAALALVAQEDFLSGFPSIFLLIVNVATTVALAFLAFRLFEDLFKGTSNARKGILLVLFVAGPLWALSSPEAKYVSGGVVGNLLGNFFIPLILLSFFRALQERSSLWFGLALFLFGTLGFTHHLSTLILLYIAVFATVAFIALSWKGALDIFRKNIRPILSPFPIAIIIFILFTIFFVYTPTYLDIHAIDTALGSPSRTTREGLEFSEFSVGTGGSRLGLGLVAILTLVLSKMRRALAAAFMVGWGIGLIIMSLFPGVVFLDIPSNRIGTYASFPIAILSAFALLHLFFRHGIETSKGRLLRWSFAIVFSAIITGGFFDNTSALSEPNASAATQTYIASDWLSKNTPSNEWILKDHNYIAADSWMKLFFMKDYAYPLSRGNFRRYANDAAPREQCTLLMISAPNTPKGITCFKSTGVSTVVINPRLDSTQFNKAKNMSLVYTSDEVAIYRKSQ